MVRKLDEIEALLDSDPQSVSFVELRKLCESYFGACRQHGSHLIFRTGLREPAIVNIQPKGRMAKPYQCRQAAAAIRAVGKERR